MVLEIALFAVPWQALQLDTENKRFILDVLKEKLENAPGFDKDNWPDMASQQFGSEIHDFYNTQANMAGRITSTGSMMGQGTPSMQSGSRYDSSTGGGNLSGQPSSLSRQSGSVDDDMNSLNLNRDDPNR